MDIPNWWAVLVATALAFVLGGLWYGPVFGQAWMNAIGKTEEDIEPTPMPFIVSFFTAGITAVVLAMGISALSIAGAIDGAILGLAVGIGFIATAMASDTAFCGWGMRLFLIQAGYRVTYSILMGAVLGGWQ
ncbi:MAG: DUF1761 domain-containing protein [Pseudomonadota bacterium]